MRKKFLYVFLLSLIETSAGFSQSPNNSLLWEISGNGLSQPSYLFGTIHILDKEDFFIRKEIDSVFEMSEQIVFEIKMDDIAALNKIMAWRYLSNGKKLSDYCTPEEFEQLKTYMNDSLSMDIEMFNDQKPFIIEQLTLMSDIKGQSASYEGYFMEKAMSAGTPLEGLELIDDQLHIFDTIPYEEQMDWLIESITNNKKDETGELLLKAYKHEDLDAIDSLLLRSTPELLKYENLLISGRNKRWIPVIEKMIRSKTSFIAVGAGHLAGSNGVIRLLIDQGYTLRPI